MSTPLASQIIARVSPYGNPWSDTIQSWEDGSTPMITYAAPSGSYVGVTRVNVHVSDGFEVSAGGYVRVSWGTATYQRIDFSNVDELKTVCFLDKINDETAASASGGVYPLDFATPYTVPVRIVSSNADSMSIICYSSGGVITEDHSLVGTVEFSAVGYIDDESSLHS